MKAVFKTIAVLGSMITGFTAFAQPGLGQLQVEVTERYKAQVGEAVKISEMPNFEDTTTSKLPVSYRITSEPIEVHSEPEPISPARISQVPVEQLHNGLVRLGFGVYTTPLAEVYWNSGRSSNENFGFWGRHFSTQDGVEQTIFENNALNQNEFGAYYNRFYRNMKWESQIFGKWDKYSYYGIDRLPEAFADMADTAEFDPQYNWFRQYDFKTKIKGEDADDLGWVDELGLQYYNFTDIWNSQENFVDISSKWTVPAGETGDLKLGLNATWFGLGFDSILNLDQSYLTIQARPKVTLVAGDLLFDFGLNVYGNDYTSDSTGGAFNFRFFPEINVSYPFVEDVLSAYGGVTGYLEHNTYRSFTKDNPYIIPGFLSRPTRNTDIYLGVEGIISSTTSFNLRGGYMFQKDLVLYYRDPFYREQFLVDSLVAPPSLGVIYDNSQTFYARGEISLNLNDNLQVSAFGELRAYNMDTVEEAWHRPAFIAGVDASYTFREKLKFGTELDFVGAREAFASELNPDLESTLSPYLAASFNFEYIYNSRLSGFLRVTNLANQQYERYLGYQAQSIGFLMGFGYRF